MTWNSILTKIVTIAKAKINSAVDKFDDKEARLDLAMDEFGEAVQMLKKAQLLMGAKKNQIGDFIVKAEKSIVSARNMARQQAEAGRTTIARMHMGTVAYGEASITEWVTIQQGLGQDIESISEDVIFCEQGIVAVKMRVTILKAREDVADARNEVYEQLTGLKNRGLSLAETLSDYTMEVEEKEATAQAYKDMMSMGILRNVVKEALPEPEYGRVDDLMKELENEIQLATTTELNPEEIEMYAKHR